MERPYDLILKEAFCLLEGLSSEVSSDVYTPRPSAFFSLIPNPYPLVHPRNQFLRKSLVEFLGCFKEVGLAFECASANVNRSIPVF